jgi:predicted dehydrogenase
MYENEGRQAYHNFPCENHYVDYRLLLAEKGVEVVIVSTPTDSLAEITIAALRAGKHVLVEKPAASSTAEIDAMIESEKESGKHVRVGFNLRYHRAIRKAFEIQSQIGTLLFIRAHYGHGGRELYGEDWRMKDQRGETIDQGVHLIDLSLSFIPNMRLFHGVTESYYWSDQADDNCFMILKSEREQIAFLHASCTEWRNSFNFEVVGSGGKIVVDGLGGSYGTERITLYKKIREGEPPEITTWEYPMADDSLEQEMKAFIEDIEKDRTPDSGLKEARKTLEIVEQIYE